MNREIKKLLEQSLELSEEERQYLREDVEETIRNINASTLRLKLASAFLSGGKSTERDGPLLGEYMLRAGLASATYDPQDYYPEDRIEASFSALAEGNRLAELVRTLDPGFERIYTDREFADEVIEFLATDVESHAAIYAMGDNARVAEKRRETPPLIRYFHKNWYGPTRARDHGNKGSWAVKRYAKGTQPLVGDRREVSWPYEQNFELPRGPGILQANPYIPKSSIFLSGNHVNLRTWEGESHQTGMQLVIAPNFTRSQEPIHGELEPETPAFWSILNQDRAILTGSEPPLRDQIEYALLSAKREHDGRIMQGTLIMNLATAVWDLSDRSRTEVLGSLREGERLAELTESFGPDLNRIYEDPEFRGEVTDYLATDHETRQAIRQVGDNAREAEAYREIMSNPVNSWFNPGTPSTTHNVILGASSFGNAEIEIDENPDEGMYIITIKSTE